MTPADAPQVAELARQLGYNPSTGEISDWLDASHNQRVALVVEEDDKIVGWIQAHDLELLQYPRVLEIGGLIVDERARGAGIGKLLVVAVADWGRDRGHTEIFVRSNVTRDGAHNFYEGLGFERTKTSHTFSVDIEAVLSAAGDSWLPISG